MGDHVKGAEGLKAEGLARPALTPRRRGGTLDAG
jgi:hypothetical protein